MIPCPSLCRGVFLLATLLLAADLVGVAVAGCLNEPVERAAVSAITDRAEILLADGRRARLAGLDVPDPGRGDPTLAASARAWLTSRLAGHEIGLRALAAKTDRWGRLLADIIIDGESAPSAAPVSLGLLAAGLARVRPELEARDCLAKRLAAEAAARLDGLGVWTDPYYGVVEAVDLEELRQRDGQFAVVEGVVLRVGHGRYRTYLDFGRRDGFTVVALTQRAKVFERAGIVFAALAGARIRVRGAMDNRFGLRMAISGPDEIELMSQGAGTSEAKPGK